MLARRHPAIPPVSPLHFASRMASRSRVAGTLRITTWVMLVFVLIFPMAMHISSSRAGALVPPGLQVGDVAIGGMTLDAARAAIANRVEELAAQPATLDINGKVWTPALADLGISYDVDASLAPVMAPDSDEHGTVVTAPRTMPLAISFNPLVFDAYVDTLLDELGGHAVNAGVVISGVEANVTAARAGVVVDRSALQATLVEQVSALQPVVMHAEAVTEDAPITTAVAEDARGRVEKALAESWVLTAGEESWTLEPAEVASALRVVEMDNVSLQLSWDAGALEGTFNGIAGEVETGATDSWVQDLATKSWLVPATEGREMDRAGLVAALQQALTNGEHEVEIPMRSVSAPGVTTAEAMADLGITGVIGEGNSIYAGSAYGRTNNVEVAAYMVDGTLVAPGEIFSFNDAVGSLFNGQYLSAGSYIDGPAGESVAGGVCQVSTTVFRAALDAGLPIVEWWPHSYRSPFYELGGWSPGFDAAIVQDSGNPAESTDFRFRNTTDAWLMISAQVSDGELKVGIHGADPGYTVEFDDPYIETVEWATDAVSVVVDDQLPPGTIDEQPAMDGLRVTVVRYVYDADGDLVSQDSFVTTYGSYGAIRRLSPDMAETAQAQ